MKSAPFAYQRPGNLAAALALMGQTERVSKIIAGGQSLGPVSYTHLTLPTIYSV